MSKLPYKYKIKMYEEYQCSPHIERLDALKNEICTRKKQFLNKRKSQFVN